MNHAPRSSAGGFLIAMFLLLAVLAAAVYMVKQRRQHAADEALQQALTAEEVRRNAKLAAAEVAEDDAATRTAVESVLRTQQDAWNRGDVDAFVEHYWKSDDVTFSGGGATTRGWDATAARYREKYPTRETMGQLSFSNLEVTPLGPDAALVLGAWALARDDEPVSGNFTLVFRKMDGRWVIVHDHTSRAAGEGSED